MTNMTRKRIGLILSTLGKKDTSALRYAILHLNKIQKFAEFEIIYGLNEDDEFHKLAKSRALVDRTKIANAGSQLNSMIESRINDSFPGARSQVLCDRYLAVCNCRVAGNFYLITTNTRLRILAVGGWQRYMAPPSLLEFIVFNTLKQGIREAIANPDGHLASKGCIFDFNRELQNTRNAILSGYICEECHALMAKNSEVDLDALGAIMGGRWLGDPDDPFSAFSELQRLGFQPFQASEVQDKWYEKLPQIASNSIIQELIKYLFLAIAIYFSIRFGLDPLSESLGVIHANPDQST